MTAEQALERANSQRMRRAVRENIECDFIWRIEELCERKKNLSSAEDREERAEAYEAELQRIETEAVLYYEAMIAALAAVEKQK